jgi:hypothetical protein
MITLYDHIQQLRAELRGCYFTRRGGGGARTGDRRTTRTRSGVRPRPRRAATFPITCRLHSWFDQSNSIAGDFRHRALRHHAEGIFMLVIWTGKPALMFSYSPLLRIGIINGRELRVAPQFGFPLRVDYRPSSPGRRMATIRR